MELPKSRGWDAVEFLAAHGLVAVEPGIRSRDYTGCLSDPFGYYLRRRLGLRGFLDYSEALSHGSWFHARAELVDMRPDRARHELNIVLEDRCKEIARQAEALGIGHEEQKAMIDRERHDALTAMSWFDSACAVTLPKHGNMRDFLNKPGWELLGTEVEIICRPPEYKVPLIATLDRVMYHPATNDILIDDFKTTSLAALDRAQKCTVEFQTWHYPAVLDIALTMASQGGEVEARGSDGQPIDLTTWPMGNVKGMRHVIVQKPSIVFGSRDRHYWYEADGKRSGTTATACLRRADGMWLCEAEDALGRRDASFANELDAIEWVRAQAQKKPDKVFSGEPDVDLYIARCHDWYLGQGEHLDLKPQWDVEPPVNISTTQLVSERDVARYHARLALIEDFAVRPPRPDNFPDNPDAIDRYGRLSPWAAFYLTNIDGQIHKWVDIVRHGRFIVHHADRFNRKDTNDQGQRDLHEAGHSSTSSL